MCDLYGPRVPHPGQRVTCVDCGIGIYGQWGHRDPPDRCSGCTDANQRAFSAGYRAIAKSVYRLAESLDPERPLPF